MDFKFSKHSATIVAVMSAFNISTANAEVRQAPFDDCPKVTDVSTRVGESLAKQVGLGSLKDIVVYDKSSKWPPFYQGDFSKKPFGCIVT